MKDNHTFKFGGEARLEGYPAYVESNTSGTYALATDQISLLYLNGTTLGGRTPGFGYASFLLDEFGKLVLIQEAENQIITPYQVCEQRPADATLLGGCLEQHVQQFGRAPERVAADPGFFSTANESQAQQMGVRQVSIPSHDTKSAARK